MELIRQLAASIFAITIAWDIFRDQQNYEEFPLWVLALHFIYFQLPLKSRAIAFFHPISFSGALAIPICYYHLLLCKPNVEKDHMDIWEISWTSIVIRSAFIYGTPLICHIIDMITNQTHLITSYQTKPKKFQYAMALLSLVMFDLIHGLLYPNIDDQQLQGVTALVFSRQRRFIVIFSSLLSFFILYVIILRKAYPRRTNSRRIR
eukprot:gene10248-21379_t